MTTNTTTSHANEPPQPCADMARYLRGRHPRYLPARIKADFYEHVADCPNCSRVSWDHFAAQSALKRLRPEDKKYLLSSTLLADSVAGEATVNPANHAEQASTPPSTLEPHPSRAGAAVGHAYAGVMTGSQPSEYLVQSSLFEDGFAVAPDPALSLNREPAIHLRHLDPAESGAGVRLAALFGYELTTTLAGMLAASSAERLSQHVQLLTRVEAPMASYPIVERALEVRYVVWPAGREDSPGEACACYLLARVSAGDVSPAYMQEQARIFHHQLSDVLAHVLPGYAFTSLGEDSLAQAIQPFDIADTGEIRARPLASVSNVSHMPQGVPDADALVEMLLLQPSPTLVSICVSPDSLVSTVQADTSGNLRSIAASLANGSIATRALADAMQLGHDVERQRLIALSQHAFRCRIQIASAVLLTDGLIATALGEFGGTGTLTAQAAWQNVVQPITALAEFARPRTTPARPAGPSESLLAQRNLRTLGFEEWGGPRGRASAPRPMAILSEVVRLFSMPMHAAWLQHRAAALSLPFNASVRSGSRIGHNVVQRGNRSVLLPSASRPFHTWIVGQPGTGKSTLLETLILQDIMAGRAVIAIDPHGDLIHQILGKVPEERIGDVIVFDPADTAFPLGLNPLIASSEEQQALVVSSFIGLLRKLFDPQHVGIVGPRFEHAVRNGLLTVMSNPDGATLVELMRVLTDTSFVKSMLPHVKDPLVTRYWTDQIAHTSDFHKSEVLDYIVSKFGPFVTDFTLRRILGQTRNAFTFREAMDTGKIVLISLAKGKLGSTNANFLGLILLPMILQAALSRAELPLAERREACLYVDEFHNYETDSLALMMAEARKYKLALTLANQHVGQLTGDIRDALIGNVGNVIALRLGVADAQVMEQVLAPSLIKARDIAALPNYTAYARLLIDGRRTSAFTLQTEPVAIPLNYTRAERIRAYSRALYGHPRAQVDEEIRRRAQL